MFLSIFFGLLCICASLWIDVFLLKCKAKGFVAKVKTLSLKTIWFALWGGIVFFVQLIANTAIEAGRKLNTPLDDTSRILALKVIDPTSHFIVSVLACGLIGLIYFGVLHTIKNKHAKLQKEESR